MPDMKLPANWKTTLFGAVTMGSLFVVANPDLISAVISDAVISKRLFSFAALISGYVAFSNAKDWNATGGTRQQTVSGALAAPGTSTLVGATVKATIASNEPISPEQRKAANS